jgi:hypothetical protein
MVLGEAFPFSSIVGLILILSGSWFATRASKPWQLITGERK